MKVERGMCLPSGSPWRPWALALALGFALLAAGCAMAPVPARDFDELLRLSGLLRQVEEVGPAFLRGIDQAERQFAQAGKAAPGTRVDWDRMRAAAKDGLAVPAMRRDVERHLGEELSAEDEAQALAFLRSELGTRLRGLGRENLAQAPTESVRDEAAMVAGTATPERVQRMIRLERATRVSGSLVDQTFGMMIAIAAGVALSTPPQDSTAADAMTRQWQAQRATLVANLRQAALRDMLHAYRDLGDEDLDRFLAFV
jgi:hypothetical protein